MAYKFSGYISKYQVKAAAEFIVRRDFRRSHEKHEAYPFPRTNSTIIREIKGVSPSQWRRKPNYGDPKGTSLITWNPTRIFHLLTH